MGGSDVITKLDLLLSLNYHIIHTGFREEVGQFNTPRNEQERERETHAHARTHARARAHTHTRQKLQSESDTVPSQSF